MILLGADADVSAWASEQLTGQKDRFKNDPAIGVVRDGVLICGVIYSNYAMKTDNSPLSIEMSIASTDKRWATKKNLRVFFNYPFIQLGVERVLTVCSAERPEIIRFNERIGFVKEGLHRKAWPMGGDAVSFGMLKPQCKWI